jgi:hypothetical protein
VPIVLTASTGDDEVDGRGSPVAGAGRRAGGLGRASAPTRAAEAWCAWVVASTLGLILAARLFLGLVGLVEDGALPIPRGPWSETLNLAALGVVAGAGLGLCQAAVLWPRVGVRGALAWVAATAAGTASGLGIARGGAVLLGLLGAGALFRAVDEEVWRMAAFALLGAAVGCGLWLVLRRRLARAAWWVPTCAVATPATALVLRVMPSDTVGPWWLLFALFGGLTGVLLPLLPRRDLAEAQALPDRAAP